tara:strand:+ start:18 stop:515 length:498 start_codon:yes stop_codon:yes gene_type:complete
MYTELRERYLGKINSKLTSVNKNLKYLLDVDTKFLDSIKNNVQTGGAQNVVITNDTPVQFQRLGESLANHRANLNQKLQVYRNAIATLRAANTQLTVNVNEVNKRIDQYAKAVTQLITQQNAPDLDAIQAVGNVQPQQKVVAITPAVGDTKFIDAAGELQPQPQV